MTQPIPPTKWEKLDGRGLHELRFDELPDYVMWLVENYADGPHLGGYYGVQRKSLRDAIVWIVGELERKTNDERVLAIRLDAIRSQPRAVPEEWYRAMERALPFLVDQANEFEDDGDNEPLDVADTIRDLLDAAPQPGEPS